MEHMLHPFHPAHSLCISLSLSLSLSASIIRARVLADVTAEGGAPERRRERPKADGDDDDDDDDGESTCCLPTLTHSLALKGRFLNQFPSPPGRAPSSRRGKLPEVAGRGGGSVFA